MHQECLQRFLYQFFELISPSDAKVALIVAAPLSAPLFWKFNFSKIWTHMLLYLKTDCSYTNFSFLYVQTSSNIKKMRFYGLIWIIRPSKILLRLQEIAISCNLKQHTVESDLNEIWHSFYIPMRVLVSYFHTLLIVKKGAERGAHTILVWCSWAQKCEKMEKKSIAFTFGIWMLPPFRTLTSIMRAPLSAPLFSNE